MINAKKVVWHLGGPSRLHDKLAERGHDVPVATIHMWINRKSLPARWVPVLSEMAVYEGHPIAWHEMQVDAEPAKPAKSADADTSFLE